MPTRRSIDWTTAVHLHGDTFLLKSGRRPARHRLAAHEHSLVTVGDLAICLGASSFVSQLAGRVDNASLRLRASERARNRWQVAHPISDEPAHLHQTAHQHTLPALTPPQWPQSRHFFSFAVSGAHICSPCGSTAYPGPPVWRESLVLNWSYNFISFFALIRQPKTKAHCAL